ncbi:uncharacterized protein LOC114915529 [Cajanus cajan]|uniref:uncharacterized protein LOC114915529 n=1 Tax=Cajanus cajan TaxID=3821 RepID=UPI0010FB0713|nr:uncharacterized protein LOC114915529 [Cajanus cajan]
MNLKFALSTSAPFTLFSLGSSPTHSPKTVNTMFLHSIPKTRTDCEEIATCDCKKVILKLFERKTNFFIHLWCLLERTREGSLSLCSVLRNHWQLLVLCPISNVVVWFCSLHHKPTMHVKNLVKSSVMAVYNVMNGRSTTLSKNLEWIYPMSYKQQGHYECGYYVMNWMSEIIEGGITNGWSELFEDTTALEETKLEDIWIHWGNFILEKFRNRSC